MKRYVDCPNCNGTGSMDGRKHGELTCLECTGSGRVTTETARMLRLTKLAYIEGKRNPIEKVRP